MKLIRFFCRINIIYMQAKQYGQCYLLNIVCILIFFVHSASSLKFASKPSSTTTIDSYSEQQFLPTISPILSSTGDQGGWSTNYSSAQCCHCGWCRSHSPVCPFHMDVDSFTSSYTTCMIVWYPYRES